MQIWNVWSSHVYRWRAPSSISAFLPSMWILFSEEQLWMMLWEQIWRRITVCYKLCSEELTLSNEEVWPLPSATEIQAPGRSCLIAGSLFAQGLWPPNSLTAWFILAYMASAALWRNSKLKVSTISGRAGDRRTAIWAICNGAPVKTLNTEAQVSFPSGKYPVHVITHGCRQDECCLHISPGKGPLDTGHLEPSQTLPYASLPRADFNLHPFSLINQNSEWQISVGSESPSSKLLKLRVVCGTLSQTCTWHQKWGQCCVN